MGLVRVEIIVNVLKMDALLDIIKKNKITGMTVFKGLGCGVQYGTPEYRENDTSVIELLDKVIVMIVMPEEELDTFIRHVEKGLYTGHIGDGKIFVSRVENAFRIRTGEEGHEAIVPGNL